MKARHKTKKSSKTKRANKRSRDQEKLGTIKGKPIIIKLAVAEDEATGDGYEIYTLLRAGGDRVQVEVPRDIACEPLQLRRVLNKKVSCLPPDKKKALPIILAAAQEPPLEKWLYVRHVGWRPDMKNLVTVNGVIGDNSREVILKPPRSLNSAQRRMLTRKGHNIKWLEVAKRARHSTIAIFTLAVACAAPLIRFTGMPSFVVCLYGDSKIGKSTALLLASSFYGIGEEKHLPNLNTSVAAFQETARNFSGLLVPANETALLKIGKKGLGEQLTELVYKFAEGVEKARHSKSTFVAPEGGSDWDGALVMTSENSLTELAAVAGIERKGGEQARAIDVPARLTDHATIIDRFPGSISGDEERDEWARKRLHKIREGCAEHHGVMLDLYGRYLIAQGDRVKPKTEALMEEFLDELDLGSASEATHHAARCCALIFAGGMHGIQAKVLPFTKERLKSAVLACCRGALKISRNDTTLGERGRKRIVAKLKEAKRKDKNVDFVGTLNRFKKDGETQYAVSREDFVKWFPNQAEAYAALLGLHEQGFLQTVDGAVPKLGKFGWAITWPKFKGTGKRRIVFRYPGKAKAREAKA